MIFNLMYHFWYSATASYKFEQDKISTIGPSMVSWNCPSLYPNIFQEVCAHMKFMQETGLWSAELLRTELRRKSTL